MLSSSAAFLKLPCRAAASNTRTELKGGSLNPILSPPRGRPQVTAALGKRPTTSTASPLRLRPRCAFHPCPAPLSAFHRRRRFSRLRDKRCETTLLIVSDVV